MQEDHFDVLIIGAGSSGCAIAARVSEDPNLNVCLLEAGPDYPLLADTPDDLINSHNNSYTAHDWGFEYEPTQGRKDRFHARPGCRWFFCSEYHHRPARYA